MDKKIGSVTECIARLVAYNGSLQIAHWMADTVTNEHKALGELYDSMVDLVDSFAEVYMGKSGVITFPKDGMITDIREAPCAEGLELVADLQGYFKAGADDDLLNILADMQSALNKAKYLLKESAKPVGESEETESEEPEEEAEGEPLQPKGAIGISVKVKKVPESRIAGILKKKFAEEM